MMDHQQAELDWRDGGVPVSRQFEDPYYSLQGGLDEARHVFVAGNGLPGRAGPGFRVAELGFGSGLNLLATIAALGDCPGPIYYTSFEAFPMAASDMARALAGFPALDASALLAAMRAGRTEFEVGPVHVTLVLGDARTTLPRWKGQADAWYLDGFAPARNPELWSAELMTEIARHTAPGGTFATYTAAGAVRRALADAGFAVTRLPGYGRKRHMSVGCLT